MIERFEQLACGLREQTLTPPEQTELLDLLRGSEALRRMAAKDRLVDRLLRESRRAPVNADLVLKAISHDATDLSARTLVELEQRPPVPESVVKRGWRVWLSLLQTRALGRPRAWAVSCGIALVAIGVGLFWFRTAPQIKLGQFVAVVGQPTLQHGANSSALNPQLSTPIHLGDRVETGDADKAEIQFNEGTTLRLGFNTAVELPNPPSAIRNPQSALARPPEIILLRGQVWTKVQKLTNAPQYAIRTPVATAIAKGTEFGLKVQRSLTNAPVLNVQSASNLIAILSVKEGTVEFTNALGSVEATAMTESTARADAPPTEPKRLQTLQTVQLGSGSSWSLVSSPLALPDAAERLVNGGGWAGLVLRDTAIASDAPGVAATPGSNEVRVARVSANSPAGRAGLRPGEVLTALNGRAITNAAQVERAFLLEPGMQMALTLHGAQGDRAVTVTVTNRASLLAGPALKASEQARLAAATREMFASLGTVSAAMMENQHQPWARLKGTKSLQAAAQNNLGVRFETEDELGPAIRAYGRAVYLDAQVPLYRLNLGLALRNIGSFERAEEEFQAAERLAPGSTEAGKWLASTRLLLGRHAEALSQTEALLALAPRDHGLWELNVQLLGTAGRFTDSLEAARRAVELEPDCPTAHGYLADAFLQTGKLREAEATYLRAIELAPFGALHHMNFGSLMRNRGQFVQAEQRFRKAIELRPDFVLAYENLGLLYASTRRDAQAEETFRKALEVDPENVEILRKLIYLAAENGRLDDAETRARKVLELAPHDSGSHNDLGEVLRQKGKFDEAIQSYRKALELRPKSPGVLNNIAIIQAMRGQHAEAEKTFRTLVDLAAQDRRINPLNFLVNLAMVCGKQGKLEDAEKFYRQALALDEKDPGTCNSLAWFLADHQLKLDEALTFARRATQTAPSDPNFLDTLGWVYFQRSELDEAERAFTRALELAPQNPSAPEIREHLKKVQEKKSNQQLRKP